MSVYFILEWPLFGVGTTKRGGRLRFAVAVHDLDYSTATRVSVYQNSAQWTRTVHHGCHRGRLRMRICSDGNWPSSVLSDRDNSQHEVDHRFGECLSTDSAQQVHRHRAPLLEELRLKQPSLLAGYAASRTQHLMVALVAPRAGAKQMNTGFA